MSGWVLVSGRDSRQQTFSYLVGQLLCVLPTLRTDRLNLGDELIMTTRFVLHINLGILILLLGLFEDGFQTFGLDAVHGSLLFGHPHLDLGTPFFAQLGLLLNGLYELLDNEFLFLQDFFAGFGR